MMQVETTTLDILPSSRSIDSRAGIAALGVFLPSVRRDVCRRRAWCKQDRPREIIGGMENGRICNKFYFSQQNKSKIQTPRNKPAKRFATKTTCQRWT